MSDGVTPQVAVPVAAAGGVSVAPPTFLELNGIIFVSFAGAWVLIASSCLLIFYMRHLPEIPTPAGATAADIKNALDFHKTMLDQYRDSINFVFDLMVTKTILPVITLLLGYLFGKARVNN